MRLGAERRLVDEQHFGARRTTAFADHEPALLRRALLGEARGALDGLLTIADQAAGNARLVGRAGGVDGRRGT